MIDKTDAQRFLDDNFAPWVLGLDPKVTRSDSTSLHLEIPITDGIARVGGIVSGQALATLADTAMVLACGVHLGRMIPVATITLDTQFLRPGRGETIRAEAEVMQAGKTLIFARATLIALPSGKPIALAIATFATPPP